MSDHDSPIEADAHPVVGVPDTVLGLFFAILGVAIVITGHSLRGIGGMTIGPGTMPTIIGGLLAIFGTILAIQGLKEFREVLRGSAALLRRNNLSWYPVVVIGGLAAYTVLFKQVGFVVLTFSFVTLIIVAAGGKWLRAALFSAFITALIYVLFSNLLHVPLPAGILR